MGGQYGFVDIIVYFFVHLPLVYRTPRFGETFAKHYLELVNIQKFKVACVQILRYKHKNMVLLIFFITPLSCLLQYHQFFLSTPGY